MEKNLIKKEVKLRSDPTGIQLDLNCIALRTGLGYSDFYNLISNKKITKMNDQIRWMLDNKVVLQRYSKNEVKHNR